jgi:hydroxymethylpyrimidine pyrophosphatase-like HAD family hydrolase
VGDVCLVVTDLDRTFWFRPDEVHPDAIAAWHELEGRGLPVIVATGRRVTSTREPLAHLGLAPPAIVMNGALGLHLASRTPFHSHHYTANDAASVLAAFRQFDLEPCIYVEHPRVDVFVGTRPSTHPEHLLGLGASAQTHDLDDVVATMPVFMFGILGHDHERLAPVLAAMSTIAEAHVQPDHLGTNSFTVTPRGLSKWVGVKAYCAHAGIDPERVLAIGDGSNDVELLANAAIAVAPADAHTDAIRAADHVVAPARAGGWAEILDLV